MQTLLSILREIAEVPSFSSFEERLHPVVKANLETLNHVTWHHVPDNNLVAMLPGKANRTPVALSAHLDKINHFGAFPPDILPLEMDEHKATGQLDDAAGLAILLEIARMSETRSFPPLMLLFSEMEEKFGLTHHPHLLKNKGEGLYNGMGAVRISRYLIEQGQLPSCVMTVDTTPLFKGDPGVALYSGHWEFSGEMPGEEERARTGQVVQQMLAIDPHLKLTNNTNDYLHYGAELNRDKQAAIPSLAIEPAIHPYHTLNESVFLKDLERVRNIIASWLEQ